MRKLACAAFSFSAAIFFAHYLITNNNIAAFFAAASACAGFLGLLFTGNTRKRVFIAALSLCAGFLWSFMFTAVFVMPARELDGKALDAIAVVRDYSSDYKYGHRADITIKLDGAPDIGARLYYYDGTKLRPGDTIRFTAKFSRADITAEGDRLDILSSRGIFLTAYASGDILVTSDTANISHLPRRLSGVMSQMIEKLFPDDISPFMTALLTGRRELLNADEALTSALSVSGISHVVAVSGMHVTFLVGFLAVFIRRKRLLAVTAIPVIFIFMAMTGFTPSVTRAGVMQLALLCAPLFKHESDGITSLSAVLLILLVINPYSCASAGLQLSFAASLGIAVLSARLEISAYSVLHESKIYKNKPLSTVVWFVLSSVITTAGALVFTIPLTALYFGYVSLVAPLTNLLTLWAVSIAFSLGLLVCVLGFIALPLGSFFAFFVTHTARFVTNTARLLSSLPHAAVYLANPYITLWLVYVYAMFIAAVLLKLKQLRKFLYPVCLAVICLCVILVSVSFTESGGGFSITMLDVGQGQSIVISDGIYTAIVDCGGGSGTAAGSAAIDYLASRGITAVDVLVLTHFHSDHANGAEYLLSRTQVKALAIPDPDDSYLSEDIISLARRQRTDIIYVTQTLTVSLGDAYIVLYPPYGNASADENERGLTILSGGASPSALITGDMNSDSERTLLALADLPDIDVLIVGHHGSKYSTSEELLRTVTPELALISAGRGNSYGHPAQETLLRLEEHGIMVYRTDILGNITVSAGT